MRDLLVRLESSGQKDIIATLERVYSVKIKPGRVTLGGYPVTFDDDSEYDGSEVWVSAVDEDAARGLIDDLRRKKIKATFDKRLKQIKISA